MLAIAVALFMVLWAVLLGECGGEMYYENDPPNDERLRLRARWVGLFLGLCAILVARYA